jgi:2,4-dienoyl-CoA reductase-like NADH-dependent reductase (Old Yellow Enzyme family)
MDWNSATTKKHIKEAKAVGLILIGEGRNARQASRRTRVRLRNFKVFIRNPEIPNKTKRKKKDDDDNLRHC